MDSKLPQPLLHYVLFSVLLEVQLNLVFAAPRPSSCGLISTYNHTELLKYEAERLLEEYVKHHNIDEESVPDDVPSSSVSGSNVSEKLQDIYRNNVVFQKHILQVESYQKGLLLNPQPVLDALLLVKKRLDLHLHGISKILQYIEPESTVLPTPATPQLDHDDDDYLQKVYGWGVVFRLKEWLTKVLLVLEEVKTECD